MIGKKFNTFLQFLLLAGTVYANDLPGENKTVPEKEMTAPSDKEFAGSSITNRQDQSAGNFDHNGKLLVQNRSRSADLQSAAWQRNISDTLTQIVEKQYPAAAQILLYDIQKGKITVSELHGKEIPYFSPMSLLKPFVITAALEAGTVKMDDLIDCLNGKLVIDGHFLTDSKSWGKITVAEILKNSSNIGTRMIARKLGFASLESFLQQAGFNKSPDIKEGDLEFARYAIGAKHIVSPEDVIAAWAYMLKYPETVKAIKNPLGATAFLLKENQHKYTCAVVGYLPANKPRYILLLTAHDFTKSNGSMQGISFLHQQWKNLENKFNSMVK